MFVACRRKAEEGSDVGGSDESKFEGHTVRELLERMQGRVGVGQQSNVNTPVLTRISTEDRQQVVGLLHR